jgi:putative FmdB family regulatory protein
MPIYEYKCVECDSSQEKLQSYMQRKDEIKCDKCDGTAKRLEVNKTSFSLKGKGWYKDGYQK